jgi:predicted aldo/keto reductase-like oxidoreductase
MFWTSLERTRAGYFDFYLLHNIGGERDKAFEKYGVWDFVAEQKKLGLIKNYGFSAHATADYLDTLLSKHLDVDFVQLQINYADWENSIIQSRKCYEIARKYGKPVIVMEPVKGGSLANLPEKAAEVLRESNPIASQASWAIRFAASLEGILTVLSGMSNYEQMKDNVSFMEYFRPLSQSEYAAIEKVQSILSRIPKVPCTDCRYCEKGCPQHVSISGIFKNYNDYLLNNNIELLRGDYEWQVRNGDRASSCIGCGKCESVCPQSIPIIEELKKASAIFDQ